MRLPWRHDTERQQRAEHIERDNRYICRPHAQCGKQCSAAQGTCNPRGIHCRSRNADRPNQLIMRHDGRDQRATDAEVRGADQSHDRRDDEDIERRQIARQCQRHQRARQHCIGGAHHGEQVAMADSIAHDAENRRDKGADVSERGKQG